MLNILELARVAAALLPRLRTRGRRPRCSEDRELSYLRSTSAAASKAMAANRARNTKCETLLCAALRRLGLDVQKELYDHFQASQTSFFHGNASSRFL